MEPAGGGAIDSANVKNERQNGALATHHQNQMRPVYNVDDAET